MTQVKTRKIKRVIRSILAYTWYTILGSFFLGTLIWATHTLLLELGMNNTLAWWLAFPTILVITAILGGVLFFFLWLYEDDPENGKSEGLRLE